MARYTGPKCRLCRREGVSICMCKRCAFEKRDYAPGQHGAKRVKLSNYGIQLREKQKVKRLYGIMEKQFRKYYLMSTRSKGVTGTVLLQCLERRLDNVIFRLGFATTRPQARQIVSHGKVYVNDQRVNIPSYLVKPNDEVHLKLKDKNTKFINANIEANQQRPNQAKVDWLSMDATHFKGKVLRLPQREDIQFPINEQLIIELYSK